MTKYTPFMALYYLLIASCGRSDKNTPVRERLTDFVDPFIGTAYHGHTYPGAAYPFGQIQLSPDNGTQSWDWCSGYHYSDSVLAGFSHLHLSGTGIGDLADISFLPVASEVIFIDENKNVYIDFSARIDELGRQPYTTREFFIKHQDRIIFGSDMPANLDCSAEMYRTYFRFFETFDESFYSPDYDGTFERARWPICGIGLPEEVLKKIYYENILKVIPSLGSVNNLTLK
jgi:hypothetical protein